MAILLLVALCLAGSPRRQRAALLARLPLRVVRRRERLAHHSAVWAAKKAARNAKKTTSPCNESRVKRIMARRRTSYVPVPSTGTTHHAGRRRTPGWAKPKARPRCGGVGSCQDTKKGSMAQKAYENPEQAKAARDKWAAECVARQRARKAAQREGKTSRKPGMAHQRLSGKTAAGAKLILKTAAPMSAVREIVAACPSAKVRSGHRPGEFVVCAAGATIKVVGLLTNGVRP